MWSIVEKILGWLWSQRWRLQDMTDEHLREIARAFIGDGEKPFSVVLSQARSAVTLLGVPITDELDARIVDAIDNALAVIRMPLALDNLAKRAGDVRSAFDDVPEVVLDATVEKVKADNNGE